MKNLAPLYWHEGLFLRPHHLQQLELFQSDRLGSHLEFLSRYHWGVTQLEVERSALKNRVFEISRCGIVFPSGDYALVPENAEVASRDFGDHQPEGGAALDVYLGLARARPNEPNYVDGEGSASAGRRYRIRDREVRDQVSGENPAQVGFSISNLRVLFGPEDRGAFEHIKVAEVIRTGADQFELSDTFVPACLQIGSHPELIRICTRVRDELQAKARSLHGRKGERAGADPGLLVQLVTINTFLARLNHQMEGGVAHPHTLYATLAELSAATSTFSDDAEAWTIPAYNHHDPGPPLRSLADSIASHLDVVVPTKFHEVRLGWSAGEEAYAGTLGPEHLEAGQTYCLVFAGDDPPEVVGTQVRGGAKIGAPERVKTLITLNLRGVATRPLDRPPTELPRKAAAYFAVDAVGPEWEKIREAGRISVWLPSMPGLSVSLYVIRS
jgi:type VI secretion system protein ImpJ